MDNNKFDKETILEAFEEAINNVKKDEEIFGDQAEENADSTEELLPEETEDNADVNVDVKEAVDDEVEKEVNDISGSFKFLDIDINIEENKNPSDGEQKYSVTLTKDDKSENYPSDDISLQSIFDLIDGFLQNMVLDEASEDTNEEENADDEDSNDDKESDEEDNADDEEEPIEENTIVADELLSKLRDKYSDRVNDIFRHGLEAKQIALDMVKNEILANSVKELLTKSKDKDSEILANKKELNEASKNYLLARNMNDNYTKFYNTLVANVKAVEDNLSKNAITKNVADKTLSRYSSIVSKIMEAKQPKTVLAGIAQLDNTHKTLLAHIERVNNKTKAVLASKKQINTEETKETKKPMISKKVISTVVAGNKLNDGMIGRHSLSEAHRRYDVIDEMTAEIIRIAGFEE